MKTMLAERRQEPRKRITAIKDSTSATAREYAEYWRDWENLCHFDERQGVTEILRDMNGEIHFLHINVTVDGKLLPKGVAGAWHYFKQLGLPYDPNRVGRRFVDRKMSVKKALKIWIPNAIASDLDQFLMSCGIDLVGLATK